MKRHETPSQYARKVLDRTQMDLRSMAEIYNDAKYGGMALSIEQVREGLKTYDEMLAFVKKKAGKPKAWLIW